MSITSLQVSDSTFSLITSVFGTVSLSNSTFSNIEVSTRMLKLRDATVLLQNVEIVQLTARTNFPFCLGLRTNLTISDSRLESLLSLEQDLIRMTDSRVVFRQTTIQRYNVTFVHLTRCFFLVEECVIKEGGLKLMDLHTKSKVTAGFLEGSKSSGAVRNSYFRDVSGTNGGCFSLSISSIAISSSTFEDCFASERGGVVHSSSSFLTITDSVFKRNQATDGGSIYFACEDKGQCQCNLTFSSFAAGVAINGGVVKWTKVRPELSNVTSEDNKAEYGDFEASLPTHVVLLNSANQHMSGVSGIVVIQPILIGFLDAIDQLVKTDDESVVLLLSDNLVGTTYLAAKSGVASFSAVIVRTQPGTSVVIQVFSQSINQTFPGTAAAYSMFVYDTRKCVPGEVTTPAGCYICPSQSFSVDPLENECRPCPSYATCSGGMHLDLDSGHWRASELSSNVLLCPIQSSCLGGQNSTCAAGFEDKLCSKCASGYYLVGLSSCIVCESMPVRAVRSALFISANAGIYTLFVLKGPSNFSDNRPITVLTTLKILINFFHSILMISVIHVNWEQTLTGLFSALEMLLSLAMSSFSVECFWRDGEMSPVYLKCIFALCLPFGLLLIYVGICSLVHYAKLCRRVYFHCSETCLMILTFVSPYVLKTSMQLVSCKEVESDTLWLSADMAIQCWTASHIKYVVLLFLPTFLIYAIGVPLLFTCLLSKLTSVHSIYLTSGLQEKYNYWETVVTVRKTLLLLTLSLLGTTFAIIQNIVAMVFLYLCLEWHLRTSPYHHSTHNHLETTSLFLQMTLIACSFYFNADLQLNDTIQQALSILVLVLIVLFVVLCLVVVTVQIRRKSTIVPHAQELMQSEAKVPPTPFVSLEQSINASVNRILD